MDGRAGSFSGRIESIWKTLSKERGEAHGIACLECSRRSQVGHFRWKGLLIFKSNQAKPAGPFSNTSLGELGQGTWTTAGCRVASSLRTLTRTWTRNLGKFYHVFSSCRPLVQVRPGTWTRNLNNCGLPPDSVCLASLFRGRFPNGVHSS